MEAIPLEHMTGEEIRLRSLYVYLGCAYAAVKYRDQGLLPILQEANVETNERVKDLVLREIGILFRFWSTRQIWEREVANESDAKSLNLALMQLFNVGLRLPKDNSGVEYAQASGTLGEVQKFGHRICKGLRGDDYTLALELNSTLPAWAKAVFQYVEDGVNLPLQQVQEVVGELAKLDKPLPPEEQTGPP